jgi:hypothetical protein
LSHTQHHPRHARATRDTPRATRHGVNLTKVPLPVELCEPRTFLERLTDSWAYLDLLHAAAAAACVATGGTESSPNCSSRMCMHLPSLALPTRLLCARARMCVCSRACVCVCVCVCARRAATPWSA